MLCLFIFQSRLHSAVRQLATCLQNNICADPDVQQQPAPDARRCAPPEGGARQLPQYNSANKHADALLHQAWPKKKLSLPNDANNNNHKQQLETTTCVGNTHAIGVRLPPTQDAWWLLFTTALPLPPPPPPLSLSSPSTVRQHVAAKLSRRPASLSHHRRRRRASRFARGDDGDRR
jgi:hypothetical protein